MSSWFPASPCTVATCVDVPLRAAGRTRRAMRLLGAILVVLAGVPLARLSRGTARRRVSKVWSRLLLRALGVRIDLRQGFAFFAGAASARAVPTEGATLLVGNHVSWLDPLVMAAALPCRIVAKSEVRGWPVVGGLAEGAGVLPIDRESLHALPGAVAQVAAALREGEQVAAFPEGTTWCGRGGGAFRPAVFQAALDAGVPVTPVSLAYREAGGTRTTAPAFVGDDTLVASVLRVIAVRGLVVEVTVLPPVTAADRRQLARIAEAAVASVAGTGHPPLVSEERVAAVIG